VIKCGECGVVVNGTPCLACEKVVEAEMKISPLPNLPLIKDLVVDRKEVFERIFRVFPALARARKKAPAFDPQTAETFVRLTKCFECLICQSACPVYAEQRDEFVGPLGLLWTAQMVANSPKGTIPGPEIKNMLGMCLQCGMCSEACPCSEDILSYSLALLESAI
jgi:succinate dehydrogenase/fumarate reductase iron-sulfur protein